MGEQWRQDKHRTEQGRGREGRGRGNGGLPRRDFFDDKEGEDPFAVDLLSLGVSWSGGDFHDESGVERDPERRCGFVGDIPERDHHGGAALVRQPLRAQAPVEAGLGGVRGRDALVVGIADFKDY